MLVSHRNFKQGSHTGVAQGDMFKGIPWQELIEVQLRYWAEFYKMWLENRKDEEIKIVFYEEFKSDIKHTAEDVGNFIGLNIDQERLDCLAQHENKTFKRKQNTTKS